MFYNKRGQFYIIISLILAIAVFGITSKPNKLEEAILFEDFEDLSNNYIQESEYVINDALGERIDVETELDSFTSDYLKYAKQRNPNIQLLYVYSDGTEVKLINHFNIDVTTETAQITGSGEPLDQEILISIAGTDFSYKVPIRAEEFGYDWYSGTLGNKFNLSVAGFLHNFNLTGSGPEFKVIINLPEGQAEHIYPGTQEYDWQGSPPMQVKLRK